jgi:hypothetical protein
MKIVRILNREDERVLRGRIGCWFSNVRHQVAGFLTR